MDSKARIFDPCQVSQYLEGLRKDKQLMKLIQYNHQFDWNKIEGLQGDEVQMLIKRCQDSELKNLYELALKTLTTNDQSTLLASNGSNQDPSEANALRKSYVLYAERRKDKYDIVAASAIQTKQFDWVKITTVGLTAFLTSISAGVGVGALVGSVVWPLGTVAGGIVGGGIGGVMATAGIATKALHDYREIMPEAVYAYVFQELEEKRILSIDNNKFALQHNQN